MTEKQNLVVIPFHDWRKVQKEGGRTRDAHLISHLMKHPDVDQLLIVNRPTCLPELVARHTLGRTRGETVMHSRGGRLVRVADNTYALDSFLPDLVRPIRKGRGWFFEAYGRRQVAKAVAGAVEHLGMEGYSVMSFNAYAGKLLPNLRSRDILFDAWDNFLKFPHNATIKDRLLESYALGAAHAQRWTTNSEANRDFYRSAFNGIDCTVIRNGVDTDHFRSPRPLPDDLANIPRPIIGIGAKVTHLVDTDLLNAVVAANPNCSFVLVGQVLDRQVMKRISHRENFFYLGDKHYDRYPAYVQAFDVAMIPYVVGEREHGGDAIKMYEYLAAGKPIISTRIGGVLDAPGRLFIIDSVDEFAVAIRRALAAGDGAFDIPTDCLWRTKAEQMLQIFPKPNASRPTNRTAQASSPASRIAFCGTRGLPANYGGFETAVDEITRRFVAEGNDVEVFCRRSAGATRHTRHEGRRLVYVDGHTSRKLDTFVAAIQTGRHLWKHRSDYKHVFWFNNANLPGIIMTALAGIPMSVNTDGLEWRRGKWSWPFKAYYYLSSQLISLICRRLVSDSRGIQSYYRKHFFRKTEFIPYGSPSGRKISHEQTAAILDRFNLKAGKYLLQITRIEPDNLPLETVMSFAKSSLPDSGMAMVVVGYKDPTPYAQKLRLFDGRFGVQICDALYDQDVLQVLRANCFAYVHGNSVGGTNPALLEAMATCPRVLAIDCEFSREVLSGAGTYFDPADPAPAMEAILKERDRSHELKSEVQSRYQWDAVARSYMNLAAGAPADYTPTGEASATAAGFLECETAGVGK